MASKINPYDYEPEYSDDEGIGNVNVDKFMWDKEFMWDEWL